VTRRPGTAGIGGCLLQEVLEPVGTHDIVGEPPQQLIIGEVLDA